MTAIDAVDKLDWISFEGAKKIRQHLSAATNECLILGGYITIITLVIKE